MKTAYGPRFWATALLFLGLLTASSCFEAASQTTGLAQGYLVTSAAQGKNAALAQAGGEFRIVAANLLWSKVIDHYHHQYMAEGGDWSKNESLLPLLQTIITLDPHFVEAYELMGGAILPRTGRVAEGERILVSGIARNRNTEKEWELCKEAAILLAVTEHQPAKALRYAELGQEQTKYARDDAGNPDVFARSLMTRLCSTLRGQVRQAAPLKATPLKTGKDKA